MSLFVSLDILITEALQDVFSTERHMSVALSRKGFKPSEAFKIAHASLIKNGFLKKNGKSTAKGSRRNMKHSSERSNKAKNDEFKKMYNDLE